MFLTLIKRESWYVQNTTLTTQGPRQQIGWLKGLHPVLTNLKKLLQEMKALLIDVSPHIEIFPKNEKRYYIEKEDDEDEKEMEG